MCDLGNLSSGCGINNPPGIRVKLYFIPAEEVTNQPRTLKEMTPATTVEGATNILNEAFTYVTTADKGYWRTVDAMVDSGEITHATVGEPGSLAVQNGLNFSIVGNGPVQKEFAQQALNCCLMVAVQDKADKDHYHILGRYDDPAHFTEVTGGTGIKIGDKRQLVFKLLDSTGTFAPSYPVTLGLNTTPNT